jgi:phosphoglucosamine mutase
LERLPGLKALVGALQGQGRILLRYSGTEPLLRIMIEGPSRTRIAAMAQQLAAAYLDETGQQETTL